MLQFIITLIETSISMSIIALVFMVLTPFFTKWFTAKGLYYTWLVIIIGLIIPFRFHPPVSAIYINTVIPTMNPTNSHFIDLQGNTMSFHLSWTDLLWGLWLVGVITFILVHVTRYLRFNKIVKRWGIKIVDEQIFTMLFDLQEKLGIKQKVRLLVCPSISSPMLIGFIRPTILLPANNFQLDELSLILKHELVHFKRRDVWYKAMVLLATALHWFNPFVYKIAKEIAIQCEISCDEEVVKNTDLNVRKKYVEAIIGVIRNQSKSPSTLSTNLYSGKQGMKARVFSIMDTKNKKYGLSIVFIFILATLSAGTIVKVEAPNFIAKETSVASSIESEKTREKIEFIKDNPTMNKEIFVPETNSSEELSDGVLLKDESYNDLNSPRLIETSATN